MESQIKLISECFIKPKNDNKPKEVEVDANPQKQHHYLSVIDLALLSKDYIQKGLLFKTKPLEMQPFLDKLKHSLSLSLIHFYPLAGQLVTLKFPSEHACFIFVDCEEGQGARFIHATVDLTLADLLSPTYIPRVVELFFELGERAVNHDGHTRPLLSIQVTELLDGICIGFSMNHAIVDATSFWHLVSTLSYIFIHLPLDDEHNNYTIQKPIYEPVFPEGHGVRLPFLEPEEFITRPKIGPLREKIFHFSPASMSKLKAKANSESVLQQTTNTVISSFQALSALVWRCIIRAQAQAQHVQPGSEQETIIDLIANARPRVDPPCLEYHFGNILGLVRGTCKVGELLGNSLGWAAMLINKSVTGLNDKVIRQIVKMIIDTPFVPQTIEQPYQVTVGGSARFDAYGPEFGLGTAVAIRSGYANKEDGKVTAYPGREGRGSVDLEITLRPETMSALELDEEFMSFVSLP